MGFADFVRIIKMGLSMIKIKHGFIFRSVVCSYGCPCLLSCKGDPKNFIQIICKF